MTRLSRILKPHELLTPRAAGLYCPLADVYIDPVRPVDRALITHGHADHARSGHGSVLATGQTLAIMALRYGENFTDSRQEARLGVPVTMGEVSFTFHPAGHVLGSAQIVVAARGLTIVVSGDYKRASDPTCLPFEPQPCDVFITEATFGLPVFNHPQASAEAEKLLRSVALFPGRAHLVGAYSLGKAQRMIALIRAAGHDGPIHIHGAMEKLTAFYASEGIAMGDIRRVMATERKAMAGEIIICPPGALQDVWSRRFPDPVAAFASGWMQVRARARQRGIELPLVVSDHAGWNGLTQTIRETGAGEVWVTHGEAEALVHWCGLTGLKAKPLHLVGYGDEGDGETPTSDGAAP